MNLSKVKLVRETPEAWHVHDGEREFAVAKHGLSAETHGAIVQHFAGTPGDASASVVKPDASNSNASIADTQPAPDSYEAAAAGMKARGYQPPAPDEPSSVEFTPPPQESARPPSTDSQNDSLPPDLPLAAIPAPPEKTPRVPGADMSLSHQYDQASQAGQQAELAIGQEKSQQAARDSVTHAALAADMEQQRQQTVQGMQDAITHQKMLIDGVASQRIDPNQFWNSRSTGQKVSATIGMIVGGFGAGFSGTGKNPAMDMINDAIARDVDAQKTNLAQANNRVKMYMDLGHNIRDAGTLAMADMRDVASAQLQASASKSDIALNNLYGTKNAMDMQKQSAAERSGLQLQAYQRAAEANALQQAQLNAPLQAAQRGNAIQTEDLRKHWLAGGALTMPQLQALGVIKPNEIVNHSGGGQSVALDEKAAEKVRDAQAELGPLRVALGQYRNLLQNQNPTVADRGTAKNLRNQIVLGMRGLSGVNRLNDKELELFEQSVPDITDLAKPYAPQELDQLQEQLDQRLIATNKAYLRQ